MSMFGENSEEKVTIPLKTFLRRKEINKKNETDGKYVDAFKQEWDKFGECTICQEIAEFRCKNCPWKFYCSKQHQINDWENHKKKCKSVIWKNGDDGEIIGIAGKNLKIGTVLFEKEILLACPRFPTSDEMSCIPPQILQLTPGKRPNSCFGCYKIIIDLPMPPPWTTLTNNLCPRCNWPCHPGCIDNSDHVEECKVFVENNIKWDRDRDSLIIYAGILRGVLLFKNDLEKWKSILKLLNKSEQIWDHNILALTSDCIQFVLTECKITFVSPIDVSKFIRIYFSERINCNAPFSQHKRFVSVITNGGLPFTDKLEFANTQGAIKDYRMKMEFSVTKDVKKGELISSSNGGGIPRI